MAFALAILSALLAAAGIAYTLFAVWLVVCLRPYENRVEPEPVTLLKPLHGPEPLLREKLLSFFDQDYGAPIQMVCGVADPDDPAADIVRALAAEGQPVELVANPALHGRNAKVSNLINMVPHARHDLLILSDSDMSVSRDYLATIAATLAKPGVGAVTCLYAGRGDTGFWSRIAAAGINWQFLPSVLVGLRQGRAQPCMGSTIALRRKMLERIDGFEAFADLLADDHAIGASVRGLGLKVAVPPMILTHGCSERSLSALAAHELRWNATVRLLDGAGYAGSLVTYPLLLALIATALRPEFWPIAVIAFAARLLLAWAVDRRIGRRTAPLWTLPFRDFISFALFLAAFFNRSVDWRGTKLVVDREGRIAAATE